MDEEAIIEQLVQEAMASGDVSMMQRLAERARQIASTGNAYGTSGVEPPQPTGEMRGTGPGESRDPYARDPQMRIARGVADVAAPFVNQGITAASSVGEAVNDPTLENVTNAGAQTALAVMQPAKALGVLGAGYTAAAADDLGVIDGIVGDAMATTKKKERTFPNGYTEGQLQGLADKTGMTVDQLGNMRKSKLDTLVQQLAISQGTAGTQAEAEQKRLEREEYDRRVKTAESARDEEWARDRRFNDTATGKMFDATGGLAPLAGGFIAGKLSRLKTGPGEGVTGEIVKDYALPLASGAVAGALAYNAPTAYDAFMTPTTDPRRMGWQKYAELLPEGHPEKAAAMQQVQELDKANPTKVNPIRQAAQTDLEQNKWSRLAWGAAEGAGGALLGTDFIGALGRPFRGSKPQGPGPQSGSSSTQSTGSQGAGAGSGANTSTTGPKKPGPKGTQGATPSGSSRLSKADEQSIFTSYRANENMTPADVIAANPALTGKERQILDYMQRVESSIKATGKKDRAKAFDAVDAIRRARLAVPLAVGGYGLSQPVDPESIARAVILRQQQEGQ